MLINLKRYCRFHLLVILLCIAAPGLGAEYIVAPGDSIEKAVKRAKPGDTIFLKNGTYRLSDAIELDTKGTKSAPIKLWAYQNQRPVLDASKAENAIKIEGSYWHLKGLSITKAQEKGIRLEGNNNTLELLTLFENGDCGLKMDEGASGNLVLNCDSYKNYDKPGGGDADGFAAKHGIGKGNAFKNCRAWNNSDDGYDLMEAGNAVVLENCWAWNNGQNIWGSSKFEGNGVGYKLGEKAGAHLVTRCLAWNNGKTGFNVEENTSGVILYNNTAWKNPCNYRFDDSHGHKLRNNISFAGSEVMVSGVDHKNNSWNGGVSVSAADFASLDDSKMAAARGSDGSLPECDFLRLAPGSDLIDAGVDVGMGLKFNGRAPDLGAFESAE